MIHPVFIISITIIQFYSELWFSVETLENKAEGNNRELNVPSTVYSLL